MNKSEIRKKILNLRRRNYSSKIFINFKKVFKILKLKKFNGGVIGGYYPYNCEIDIIEILKQFEKKNYQISLPKIKKKNQMDFYNWSFYDPLLINKYGIPEPISQKKVYPNILFVPLVAFDKENNRVGYGGGFYDRYINRIKKLKRVITIGFAYSFQEVKKIKTEKYDTKIDLIITEKLK